jgi:hypothetical protein
MLPLNGCFCCPYCETGSAANWKNRIKIKMKSRKLWWLTMAFHFYEDPDLHKKKQDPDQDEESDPYLHQSEKAEPDPHRSEKPDPDPNTI